MYQDTARELANLEQECNQPQSSAVKEITIKHTPVNS